MAWTKVTKDTLTDLGYGTQPWGTSPYGGRASNDWTKVTRQEGSNPFLEGGFLTGGGFLTADAWSKITKASDSWTKITRAT